MAGVVSAAGVAAAAASAGGGPDGPAGVAGVPGAAVCAIAAPPPKHVVAASSQAAPKRTPTDLSVVTGLFPHFVEQSSRRGKVPLSRLCDPIRLYYRRVVKKIDLYSPQGFFL